MNNQQAIVLTILKERMVKTGKTYISTQDIARFSGIINSRTRRILNSLKEAGKIDKVEEGSRALWRALEV